MESPWVSFKTGSSFFSASRLNFQMIQDRSFLKYFFSKLRCSRESLSIFGKCHTVNRLLSCLGGLGYDLAVFGIVHDENIRDDHKEQSAIIVESAAVDDIRIGRLWFGLGLGK